MSRAIRDLEARLGVTLLVRSSSGVRPTSAGMEFLETAKRLLDDFDALVSRAECLRRGSSGRLTLGLPSAQTAARLRAVLLDFTRQCPEVDIRLTARPRPALLTDLQAGTLDLAVITGRTYEEGLETVCLGSEQVLLVVRKTHPLASRRYANWADFSNEVVLISRHGVGPALKDILTAKVPVLGRPPITEEHAIEAEALLSLVVAGRGVSLQCGGTINAMPADLVILEVHDGMGPTWLAYSACWKKQQTNPALPFFLALLRTDRPVFAPGVIPDT